MNRTFSAPPIWRLPAAAAVRAWLDGLVGRLVWPAILCAGLGLRLVLLSAYPLREDEAVYGYWARVFVQDPFFLHVWPDKPPLFIALLAGMFEILGPRAEAARLLNIVAATLTIPLAGVVAAKLWQSRAAGAVAGLLLALNPYAVSFAPTAYTDTLLVLWGVGAVAAALAGRGLWVGVLVAAAVMTKQQGLLYLPLAAALLWLALPDAPTRARRLGAMLVGAALVVLPILWWDSTRWAVAPSPWDLARHTYAPLGWADLGTWPARLAAWGQWLWYLGGDGWVWAAILAAAAFAGWQARRNAALLVLLAWSLGFVALHVVTTVQIWDRYLLPLAPCLAWVAAGPLAQVIDRRALGRFWPVLLLLLTLTPPAVDAARGRLPIGGDHGDYRGLVEAIRWVEHDQSGPAVLYHQVLGWHLRFYVYDDLQPEGDAPPRFDLRWFPSAAYLADNAAKQPYPPKYLIVPDWATPRDLALQLGLRGLDLVTRLRSGRFAVLEIVPQPRPACGWCVNRMPWSPDLLVGPAPRSAAP